MKIGQIHKFLVTSENPSTLLNAARTATASLASYLVARLFHLPEAYWALVSTLIVMQSTLGAALAVSVQRFAGTAIGAAVGAATATYFPGNIWVFAIAVFLLGVLCAVLRVERSAYRYASITLAIVMLVTRAASGWLIAVHRFFEVSLGIAVGLVLSAVWPERPSKARL
ncbi:MAG TPA: FUSC family protein [Bryobacteraceae bacterium]|nr:FUSC family protein [Bryobacteraceae bacterium]